MPTDKFAGDETIRVRVLKPTSQIVVNSAEIDFQSATVTTGGATQTAKVTLDKEKEMATLAFDKEIPAGATSLHIRFHGYPEQRIARVLLGQG